MLVVSLFSVSSEAAEAVEVKGRNAGLERIEWLFERDNLTERRSMGRRERGETRKRKAPPLPFPFLLENVKIILGSREEPKPPGQDECSSGGKGKKARRR